jgi:hypothetical protein
MVGWTTILHWMDVLSLSLLPLIDAEWVVEVLLP